MSNGDDMGQAGIDAVKTIDQKLEVVLIPVSDVDRAKQFYTRLGWRLDADVADDHGFRIVQLTPVGSACSIQFGSRLTSAAPGSATDTYLVVTDVQAACQAIAAAGVAVSEVFHERALGDRFDPEARVAGPAAGGATYGSFASFSDPDGNTWLLQEITARLPGRVQSATTSYSSIAELAQAMKRAEAAHGEHEARIGHADPDWPSWYAEYMVREQAGEELPS
jgi:catechol 2,3-dioxygenase-like lactoylglutathione lyase family enzyme